MTTSLRRIAHGGALLMLTVAPTLTSAQTERRTLAGSSVAVYNVAGRMIVEPGSGADVVVEVTFRGRDASRLRLETAEVRGRNALRVVYPDDDIVYSDWGSRNSSSTFDVTNDDRWTSDRDGTRRNRRVRVRSSGDGVEAWADIRVLVPNGRSVSANLGVGEMTATNVDADLTLDVASARVTATGVRGRLNIDAGSGSIEVRSSNVADLELDTGSGSVRLDGVTSRRCNVDTGSGSITATAVTCDEFLVDVGSGAVRLDDIRAPRVRVETGSGNVSVNMLSTFRVLDVSSGSGGVTVTMPDNIGAIVDIDTGSGSINSDFPVQMNRVERRSLRGRIGNGDGAIRIETGSGSVHLRRR